jgi:hypothetical protein
MIPGNMPPLTHKDFNMKAWIGGLALAGIFLSAPAMANYDDTGAGLLRDCKVFVRSDASTATFDENGYRHRCLGNIESVLGTLITLSMIKITKPLLCPSNPENMSNGVVAGIIIKYLEDHPKELSKNRTQLTMGILFDAMPCK